MSNQKISPTNSQNMDVEDHLPPPAPPSTPTLLKSGRKRQETRCVDSELCKLFNEVSISNRKPSMSHSRAGNQLAERGILNASRTISKVNGSKVSNTFEKKLEKKRALLAQFPENGRDRYKQMALLYNFMRITFNKHFPGEGEDPFKDRSELENQEDEELSDN